MNTIFLKTLLFYIAAVLLQLSAFSAWAWSSKLHDPLFRPVHQMAVEKILKSQINNEANLNLLTNQQVVVDERQKVKQSYEHAMTGLEKDQVLAQQKPIFQQQAETFIRSNLHNAILARKAGSTTAAFINLGEALHPLQDATSPSHEKFQPWKSNESVWELTNHLTKERTYPTDSNYKARLEGVVQYAYDIFMEKVSLPTSFFDADGNLLLPKNYINR